MSQTQSPSSGQPNGVHHLAIATGNIKTQIAFFTDVLGMQLVALYWMHGVKGAWHGFLKLNESCSLAFVQTPQTPSIEPVPGVSHSGTAGDPCAPGTMQHLALNVDTDADVLTMRDRIRSRGVNVIGPIDHGFCNSIYFAGPEGLTLEVSASKQPIDPRAWIDPQVVELAGISDDELKQYTAPAAYAGEQGAVAQPAIDPSKPHMAYPKKVYEKIIAMPDNEFTATRSYAEPPVKV